MEESKTLFQKIVSNEQIGKNSKYWALFLILAMSMPIFGVERMWILIAPPLFLLALNCYVQLLLFVQSKKPLMDRHSMAVPKFLLYAGNALLLLGLLVLGAVVFIPGLLEEMGAYLLEPFTTADLLVGVLVFAGTLLFAVLGSLFSFVHGQKMWDSIKVDDET